MSVAAKTRNAQRQRRYKAKGGRSVDTGTQWLAQHYIIEPAETIVAGAQGYAVRDQRSFDRLWQQQNMTVREWRAANQLWARYHASKIEGSCTGSYEGGGGGSQGRKGGAPSKGRVPLTEPFVDYTQALRAFDSVTHLVLWCFVILNQSPTQARDNAGARGNAVLVVREALERLADYWHNHGVPGMDRGADDF